MQYYNHVVLHMRVHRNTACHTGFPPLSTRIPQVLPALPVDNQPAKTADQPANVVAVCAILVSTNDLLPH